MLRRITNGITRRNGIRIKSPEPPQCGSPNSDAALPTSEYTHWFIKVLYNNNQVQDIIKIAGPIQKANLTARMYLESMISPETRPLRVNICDFDIYINPTERYPIYSGYVLATWAEPCWYNCELDGTKLYSDNQCLFASINLLARAVLTTGIVREVAVKGDYEIGYIFRGERRWDVNKERIKLVEVTCTKERVMEKVKVGFKGACGTDVDFQTVDGVLDIWTRPDIGGVNPGELLAAWVIPNINFVEDYSLQSI
ncbi:hypothetical protein BZA77DRAFT_293287 [Pyronema omphalodes]|nr:hypothetical protein BZA77DRAFT_293287 [Pyronema omphalodes]